MTVWNDIIAVFAEVGMVLGAVIVMVLELSGTGAGINRMTHKGHHCSPNVHKLGC